MIDMPHIVTSPSGKRAVNYNNCPLKKRPIKYDPEEDSDSDLSSKDFSPKPENHEPEPVATEPENLSTKPEDLSMNLKVTPIMSPQTSSYTMSTSPSSSYCIPYGCSAPFSPTMLPRPPPLKAMSNGPLEPISLNPPAVFARVSPYMPYNFSNQIPSMAHHHQIRDVFSPAPAYPRTESASRLKYNYVPIAPRPESGSPPHVSPPLKTEPSYPMAYKQDDRMMLSPGMLGGSRQGMMLSPGIMSVMHQPPTTRIPEDLSPMHISTITRNQSSVNGNGSIMKKANGYPSPTHSLTHRPSATVTRESVISCNQNVSNASNVNSHANITPTNVNGSIRYQCPDCNKSYSTFSGLSKHLQFHCASQNKKSFNCKFCDKVYTSLGALKMHIRTHTLPCKCHLCHKQFSRPWLLQGHLRTHTGEKPFACVHCNRAFADRSNLRAHLQTHSEVKKYSCKTCSKTFSRMSLLVKHEDSGCMTSTM